MRVCLRADQRRLDSRPSVFDVDGRTFQIHAIFACTSVRESALLAVGERIYYGKFNRFLK